MTYCQESYVLIM